MYFCAYSEFAKDFSKNHNSWIKMNSYSILIFLLDLNIIIFRIKNKECQRDYKQNKNCV